MPDVNIAAIDDSATTKTTSDDVDRVGEEEDEEDDGENLGCPKNETTVPVSVSVMSTTELSSFSSLSSLKKYPFRGLVGGDEAALIVVDLVVFNYVF